MVTAASSTLAWRRAPNPARSQELTVQFVLPTAEPAKLELFDIAGRRLAEREVGQFGPGGTP
jgi:hypothetical protein